MKINSGILLILGFILFFYAGCGGLKPRFYVDSEYTLYANLSKHKPVSVVRIVDENGEIDLKNLTPTSPKVIAKYCKDAEDYSCMDKILDHVENTINRVAILKHYNEVLKGNEKHIQNLEAIYQKYEPQYLEDKENLSLEYRLNDETKLYEGESIPVNDILYIGGNPLKYPHKASHRDDIHHFFPHKPKSFTKDLKRLSKSLKKAYKREIKTYQKTINYLSSYYPLTRAKKMKSGVYSFSVKAPKAITRSTQKKRKRVVVNIIGKDLSGIYPPKFIAQNRDIKISFNKQTTKFQNLSKKRIYLESLTFFYNGYKQRVPLGDSFAFSEIDPGMTTSTDSLMFLTKSFVQASIYPKVTKQKAQRKRVMFGIRLEYHISGSKETRLLLFKKKDLLWRLITGW